MSKFGTYFLMKPEEVVEYVLEKKKDVSWKRETMQCREIGDGNLNYVFRVWDDAGHSVIIKQAGEEARISSDMKLSPERNRMESEILILEGQLAPGYVPQVYFFDTTMNVCCEEDLSDHMIMRTAMLEHKTFPKFADQISTFMANTLMGTTDVVLDHQKKKELQKTYINPELCDITEALVYTEPYNDERHRNNVFAPNADFVRHALYEDEALHAEVAKLKMDFMTRAQSLLHGDLHTGSIFINNTSMKVFDPEFCFYGPMGYDIGNVVANLIFAWCNGDATGAEAFCQWVESAIEDVVNLTMQKLRAYYDAHVTDTMCRSRGFEDYYLHSILEDTAGAAGLELIRRTVGMANVKDLTTIENADARARAERICILTAKRYIMNRQNMLAGADFLRVLHDAAERA